MAERHRKRKLKFRINLTESEAKIAIENAKKDGLKMSEYIRKIITSGPVVSFVDSDMIHNLLNDFSNTKSVMDQIVSDCKAKGSVSEEDHEQFVLQMTNLEEAVFRYFYSKVEKEKVVLKINGKLVEEMVAKILIPLLKNEQEKHKRKRRKIMIPSDTDYHVFEKENEMGWRSFQLYLDDDEFRTGKELLKMTHLDMSRFVRMVIVQGYVHSSEATDLLQEVDPVVNGMDSNVLSLMIILDKTNHQDNDMMYSLSATRCEIDQIKSIIYWYLYTGEK